MQYMKTIEMTNEVIEKIKRGQLVLQTGQWITIDGFRSRYVGITKSGSFWAQHYNGRSFSTERFSRICKNFRLHRRPSRLDLVKEIDQLEALVKELRSDLDYALYLSRQTNKG